MEASRVIYSPATTPRLHHRPFGLLQIKDVHVGNIRASEINITGREAAIHALELFDRADERSRRVRLSKNRTHYPEPLPLLSRSAAVG